MRYVGRWHWSSQRRSTKETPRMLFKPIYLSRQFIDGLQQIMVCTCGFSTNKVWMYFRETLQRLLGTSSTAEKYYWFSTSMYYCILIFLLKVPSLWPLWPNSMHPCGCLYVMGWAQNYYVTAPKSNWGKLTWSSQNEASHTDWLLWWGKILWHISNSKAFLFTKMMVGVVIKAFLIMLQSKAPNVCVSIIWWTFVCI